MNGKIELELNGSKVTVLGGPYRDREPGIRGVKLAAEITAPYDVKLDIEDFGVPEVPKTIRALAETIEILDDYGVVYIGCAGGIGRTGMFMALLALVVSIQNYTNPQERNLFVRLWVSVFGGTYEKPESAENLAIRTDVVSWIRARYIPNAIETTQQEVFIAGFPLLRAVNDIFPKRI